MKRGLFFSSVALAIFLMISAAGADVKSALDGARFQVEGSAAKPALSHRRGRTIDARAYRSPGARRKLVIRSGEAEAEALARAAGAVEVSDYGSYKLFVIEQAALDHIEDAARDGLSPRAESNRTDASRSREPFVVRDDFNVLLLRSCAIDTTAGEAEGRFFGLGARAASRGGSPRYSGEKLGKHGLRLIQFVGPVKRAWLDELRDSGLELIAYVPSNGYLVRGDAGATERFVSAALGDAARAGGFIQWEGPFTDEYKIHPAIAQAVREQPDAELTVAVQVARGGDGSDRESLRGSLDDVRAARELASSLIGQPYDVLGFTNIRMRVSAARIGEIAALGNVINIEPWTAPQLTDEVASQIVAADLTDDGKQARGPGYMAWLAARGFTSQFNFTIDVTDTGLDRGQITADKLHPDFLNSSGQSRVVYARDYTSEQDPGDPRGHGTINLSIAGGASRSADKDMRDGAGFNYGLGVAPFALLGSSRIFQSTGRFDLVEPYTKLISEAYRDGARVSSNSWASITNSYTIDAQEYDARVRDAVPAQAGNQEIAICFAAGNAGGGGRIGSPATAKNVIAVAASENPRKSGTDGCGVADQDADSAVDIAFFSSGGITEDGRLKPDCAAPGTHVQGAASQHPEFNGEGVCGEDFDKPFFPRGQTLYTWSSGTSHSTPIVAGAAALIRQFFVNREQEPSAALIKALLVNTTTYMTGELAGGDLPHNRQGWGLINLDRIFNDTPKIFVNQIQTFAESGQEFVITGEAKESSEPFRVTLVWTDAPGMSTAAPWVNDLDLEVSINGQTYVGNNFIGQQSQPGGVPNAKDNIESVWLPAGTVGTFIIRVRAANVAGDGVPGNSDLTDQDFALVVYNGERKDAPVAAVGGVALSAGADSAADPGEAVSMTVNVRNLSPVALTGGRATISTVTPGVTIATDSAELPTIAGSGSGDSLTPFAFTVAASVACGTPIEFTLDVSSQGSLSRVPFTVLVGRAQPTDFFLDDAESGQSKWTHGSAIKKKKNRIDTWTISTRRFRSGGSAWFTPDLGRLTNAHLDTLPITLPADARNLRLVFFHTFEFEAGQFDGGRLEISTEGGDFEDLGPRILRGRYNGLISIFSDNPLVGRPAWVDGRLGQFQQVVVDLTSYAGKTVVIRFRIVTDSNVKAQGWYVDDVTLRGDRASCVPVAMALK
jgi:hypothetical protein